MSEINTGASDGGNAKIRKPKQTKKPTGQVTVGTNVEEVIKALQDEIATLKDSQDMLLKTVDLGRLDHEMSKRKKQPTPIVRVSTWNGNLIVGWRNFFDQVERDSDGVWHEKQLVEIIFENESKEVIPLLDFFRRRVKIFAEVQKRNVLNKDELQEVDVPIAVESFKLKIIDKFKDERERKPFKDLIGREVTLGGEFVN